MSKRNKLHSKLDKEYRELKRRITSELYMLEDAKSKEWDCWSRYDREEFYRIKASDILARKESLKQLHKQAREMKTFIWQINHRECCVGK